MSHRFGLRPLARKTLESARSLRARLLALVLIPLAGCGVFAGAQIVGSVDSERAAGRIDAHIRSAAAVDVARGAFEEEILPGFAATFARTPGIVELGATAAELKRTEAITDRLPGLRRTTDAAIDALAGQPLVAADGRRFSVELAKARRHRRPPSPVERADRREYLSHVDGGDRKQPGDGG